MMIKLPVTGVSIIEGTLTIWDRDGVEIEMRASDLADALNAAPKRVFEGLTVEALGEMLSEAGKELGDPPGDQFAKISWVAAYDAALLSRLQAFAAPQVPQWQPIETAPRDGTEFDAWTRWGRVTNCVKCAQWGYVYAYDEEAARHSKKIDATHWMPLPAPPEAQGGENG